MASIRVLLVEDHTIVRKGLRSLLEYEPDIEIVGEAADGREALQKIEELTPDVALMDLAMPGLNGLEATRQSRRRFPHTSVLILSVHTNEEYVLEVLRAGASGYVVKKAAPDELVGAIKAVFAGESYLSPSVSRQVIDDYLRQTANAAEEDSYQSLTDREREVLQLLAEGHTNREVAEMLSISVKTVETHRAHLLEKLGISTLADLIKFAIRKGVITLDD